MTEFSIAIPAHDRGENGPKWMKELLDSLQQQTCQDFEVVVSDQSKNDNIMNVCKEYDFDFTYIKYEGSVPCENINIAVDNCEGRIVKIMFSDDIFMSKNALERIKYEYDTNDSKTFLYNLSIDSSSFRTGITILINISSTIDLMYFIFY